MAVTVATIRTRAKDRSDMTNRNFVSDSEWITYIDSGYKELYDILVSKYEDWYTISTTFSVPSGASVYSLPANFYKLRGVDRTDGSLSSEDGFYPLQMFNFQDRNRDNILTRYGSVVGNVQYRIIKDSLMFTPKDKAPGNYRIWYVPRAPDLTLTTDTIDGVNGWEEYVVLVAAIKALTKEESDTQSLEMEKMMLKQRIENMSANRDAGQTERVADVTIGARYTGMFY